jgi:hypothetical protein
MKSKLLLFVLAVATIPAAAARADLVDNLSVEIRLGRRAPPPPPAVVVMVPDNGPRDPGQWERRGRWYQRSQVYYYYPGGDVYYRASDRVWFYQQRGQWRSGRHLPETMRLDFNQVVTRYPANYFGTRVRLRDERRDDRHDDRRDNNNRRDNDHDGRDSDREGRDKDKGKGRDNRR